MTSPIEQLNQQFGIERRLRLTPGHGGLPRAIVTAPGGTGEVYLHGGHITAWQPTGYEPVIWMSREAVFAEGKAIRGGVPVCFPWFGPKADDPDAPAHGLVRTQAWQLAHSSADDKTVTLALRTTIDGWAVTLTAMFGPSLTMTLAFTNTGASPATAEAALHTYFAVGDVRQAHISGLEHADYLDKVEGGKTMNQGEESIRFAGETDRVYLNTDAPCDLHDPVLRRRITVGKTGSRATVVWNPWIDKSARLADFGDDEWGRMCCIETAAVGEYAITLDPGATHELTATINVERVM
ncbi:MAG: D-hexose-6-phosphate mutarotase [Planctomycetes bacterium]|jgi:D-hexose-6-phosphate mutarotase|nr:D-hexose-6-phosphate mutarotase [Planctomycetota bacterium]